MAKRISWFIFHLFIDILLPLSASCAEEKQQVYIVQLGEDRHRHRQGDSSSSGVEIEETHRSYLQSVKETEEEAKSSLLYTYKHTINGFAAVLTPLEASYLSELDDVVSVFPARSTQYSVQTTRSWEFVGLEEEKEDDDDDENPHSWNSQYMGGGGGDDLLDKARYGKDVIIGLLDSGVWPESPSFSDQGMQPIPKSKSWKGICQEGVAFNSSHCNKKIIGARYYVKGFEREHGRVNGSEDYVSARDMDGHGSHTASTAGGRRVPNVGGLGGLAQGTASGGAPWARLAIYKVCWAIPNQPKANGNTCYFEDMLAGMDDAISDGVDIISVSIGTHQPIPYHKDAIAIGALHAAKRNILVVTSAGNAGPAPSSLSNPAPWLFTVGASSLDRAFFAPVLLGNGHNIMGESVTSKKLKNKKMYPLVNAKDVVVSGVPENVTAQCLPGSLEDEKVKGKIVVCWRGSGTRVGKGTEVKRAGGVGLILANSAANGNEISVDNHFLPATAVTYNNAAHIVEYMSSTSNPMATILPPKTLLHYKPAPFMAGFTSQGPNLIDPYILKPDITAPGLNILAAWSEASSPTKLADDERSVKYNFQSGTSMSCPHVSGVAALLRAIHPHWSISAIRSALMTTAGVKNNLGKPIRDAAGNIATPFEYGSGHLQPTKAADPGLIYDASYQDYLVYLCSSSSNNGLNKYLDTDTDFKCPENPPSPLNLNYPSLAIPNLNATITLTITRTLTNVGRANSTYYFSANPPPGVRVKASPSVLYFHHIGHKQSFNITVSPRNLDSTMRPSSASAYVFGSYTWTMKGFYRVRSPIAVYLT